MTMVKRFKANVSIGLLLVGILTVLLAACGSDPTPTPKPAPAAPAAPSQADLNKAKWDKIVAAAKQEGEVVFVSSGKAPQYDAVAKAFEKKYPEIDVVRSLLRTGDFQARIAAETAAKKISTDVYSSGGGPALDRDGYVAPYDYTPSEATSSSVWSYDAFTDIKSGKTNVIYTDMAPNYILVNNELCPVGSCVESYKDLSDPKWKGKLLMVEPIGVTTGSFIMGFLYEEYGEEWARAVVSNIGAMIRGTAEGEKMVIRGEWPIFVTGKAPKETFKLPKPHPLRAIRPADGLIPSVSGAVVLKDGPNPNAAQLLREFILTKEGQQAMADVVGGGFIRNDVTAAEPEMMQLAGKIFPTAPTTPEFQKRFPTYVPMWEEELKKIGLR